MFHPSESPDTNAEKPRGRDEVIRAIVSAAVPLIAERGIRDVTFRDIARVAQVQHSLITRHFGTKTTLVEHIAEYLGDTLFRSAGQATASFVEVWDGILRDRRTELRALVRILLDGESKGATSPKAVQRMQETVQWFREKLAVSEDRLDASLTIYVTVSFLMGAEVFGTHIQRIMSLTDQEFHELRPRAIRVLLESLTDTIVRS
jgi:AcrR family transcriptional regulator